nr:hypothetical protein [Opitutaceae bacterium]
MKVTTPALRSPRAAFALTALIAALPASVHAQIWDGDTNAGWGTATNWSAAPAFTTSTDLSFPTSAVPNALTTIGANRIA